MHQLLIFPYNGNGLEALDCLGNNFELIGFVDDTKEKQGVNEFGHPVFDRSAFEKYPNAQILAVPGSSLSYLFKEKIISELSILPNRFATVIHPKANVSLLSKVGNNVLIMAGVVVTSNAVIGNHVCILPNTVIHHDCAIDDYSIIGSNVVIASNTKIEFNCYIGSGSNIIGDIVIGEKSLIGLGSNVINSVPKNVKVVGNPAKII